MMAFITTLFLLSLPLGVAYYFLFVRGRRLLDIPGPSGVPLLGNALQLDPKKPNDTLYYWAKQFGAIFKFNLFGEDIVVVNSVEGLREMLVVKSMDFSGRPSFFRISYFIDDFDIVFHDVSPRWSLMKKTAMAELKQVGESLKKLEDITIDILNDLEEDLVSYKGQPIDLRKRFHEAVAMITFSLVHGRKLTAEDHKEMMYLDQKMSEITTPTGKGAELDLMPWLRFFCHSTFLTMKRLKPRAEKFFKAQLRATMAEYRQADVTCVVDGLLRERQRFLSDHNRPEISLGNIDSAGRDLLTAGVLTTSSALYYLVALMVTHPKVQEQAYQEVIKVIGDRTPMLKDRLSLPFIESMILEMLRLMSHVPVSIPHKTVKDTNLLGYNIPKNTQVWSNLWYVHHDASLWKDPWKFKADRFLDNEGKLVPPDHVLRKQLFAFGAGRRVCVGESMARNRLFLFIVFLLQRFQFLQNDGVVVNCDPRTFQLGIVLRPDDYQVRVVPRKA